MATVYVYRSNVLIERWGFAVTDASSDSFHKGLAAAMSFVLCRNQVHPVYFDEIRPLMSSDQS
jgi:hypothetical protein